MAGVLVHTLGVLYHVLRPVGGDQVELLEEIEDGVFLPVLVLEALVIAGGLGHGRGLLAQHLGPGVLPELAIGIPQLHLGIHELLRVVHVGLGDDAQRLGDLLDGGQLRLGFSQHRIGPLRHQLGNARRLLEDLGHVLGELHRIRQRVLGGNLRFFGLLFRHGLLLKGEYGGTVKGCGKKANWS